MAHPFLLQILQVFMNSFLLYPVFRLETHNCVCRTIPLGITPDPIRSQPSAPWIWSSINWENDCRVCIGYNRVLMRHPPYPLPPQMQLQPLLWYFLRHFWFRLTLNPETRSKSIAGCIFWDFASYILVEFYFCFGGLHCFHLLKWRVSQGINRWLLLAWLYLRPWR
jgi:hypothetical protein